MYYQQFKPHPLLQPFVQCYWAVSDQADHLSAPEPGVIPGGFVDLIFNLGDRVYLSDSGDIFTDRAKSFVVGPFDHFQRFRAERQIDFLGVRFHPGSMSFSSVASLREVRNRAIPLDTVWAEQRIRRASQALDARLAQGAGIAEQVNWIEQFLIKFIHCWKAPDTIVSKAVKMIDVSKGQVSVAALASALSLSTRQLERKFTQRVGLSPKTYCRLTRFHQLKFLLESTPNPSVCDLAYSCGYYDQTHLIHEFRLFTGQTPARYESARPVGFFLYDNPPNC